MTKRTRQTHATAFKAKVAMATVKGERTLAESALQFDVHPDQVTEWKRRCWSAPPTCLAPVTRLMTIFCPAVDAHRGFHHYVLHTSDWKSIPYGFVKRCHPFAASRNVFNHGASCRYWIP